MSLLDQIKDAGVVGAGGAGFPTHAKLASKAEYVLLNGAECEPLLRVDQQLMQMFPEEIIRGFEAAGRLVDAKKAIIGVKGKHKEVVAILREWINKLDFGDFIEVKELPDVYPMGDEQVLVYELTGRVVPEAGIPIQVGCVVINSETALNIYRASKNIPVTESYITIAGDIPKRLSLKVPVGTPLIEVLKLSGVEDFTDYAVIDGGPMMGGVLSNLDGYILKKSKGFVILKKTHNLIQRKSQSMDKTRNINRAACEQCRMCTDLCPRYLLGHDLQPHKIQRVINYNYEEMQEQQMVYLCCQCNVCELFACPVGIYPRAANQYVKQKLLDKKIKFETRQRHIEPRISREYRMLPSKRLILRLGLHEFDKAAPMTEASIEPDIVYIAKSQHVGAPAIPAVTVGEHVEVGQLIGNIPENSLGSAIHASISGTVIEIADRFVAIRRD